MGLVKAISLSLDLMRKTCRPRPKLLSQFGYPHRVIVQIYAAV